MIWRYGHKTTFKFQKAGGIEQRAEGRGLGLKDKT